MLRGFIGKPLVFYEGDGGGSGGGSGSGNGGGDEKPRPSDIIDRYGKEPLRIAEKLADAQSDNYSLREKNRQLKQELDALKGKVPGDGAVVLTGDDAKAWESYRALGSADDLKRVKDERETFASENATLKRTQQTQDAAEAHGYKPAVLRKLPSLAGKDLVLKDVEVEEDGAKKTVKRAFVKDGDKETALPDYIQAHDPEFVDVLPAQTQSQSQGRERQGGTGFVKQSAGGGKAGKPNVAQDYIGKTYSLPKRESK